LSAIPFVDELLPEAKAGREIKAVANNKRVKFISKNLVVDFDVVETG
jgi:hypothetical protein